MRGREGIDLHTSHHIVADGRGGVVIVHGYGEHSGRYAHIEGAMHAAGFSTYALDHRGHGRSTGTRALVDKFDYLIDDLHAFISREVSVIHGTHHAGRPLFVFGHSMGGLITLAYGIRHAQDDGIAGLVVSAPPVLADQGAPALLAAARLLNRIIPAMPLAETVPRDSLSRDPAVLERFGADPLTWKEKMRVRTGVEIAGAAAWVRRDLGRIRLPILIIHGEADTAVTLPNGQAAHAGVSSPDKTLITYPDLRHETFNEPEGAEVIAAVVGWLAGHSATAAP